MALLWRVCWGSVKGRLSIHLRGQSHARKGGRLHFKHHVECAIRLANHVYCFEAKRRDCTWPQRRTIPAAPAPLRLQERGRHADEVPKDERCRTGRCPCGSQAQVAEVKDAGLSSTWRAANRRRAGGHLPPHARPPELHGGPHRRGRRLLQLRLFRGHPVCAQARRRVFGVPAEQTIVLGSSSLNIMQDVIVHYWEKGVPVTPRGTSSRA